MAKIMTTNRCRALNKRGKPCARTPWREGLCVAHHPEGINLRQIGRKGGRRPKAKPKPSGNVGLREALQRQIGVEKLVEMIDAALASESPTERAAAARLVVAELSDPQSKAVTPWWSTPCAECGHVADSRLGRSEEINLAEVCRIGAEIGLVTAEEGPVLVDGKQVIRPAWRGAKLPETVA